MKIKEYNQAMGYMTRASKSTDPTQVERDLAQKRLEEYAVEPDSRGVWQQFVKDNEAAEVKLAAANKAKDKKEEKPFHIYNPVTREMENTNDPNWNKGTVTKKFEKEKKNVVEFINDKRGSRFVNKTLNKFENRTDNPRSVAFNPTTQLFTNKDRTVAFKSYDDADAHNKSIGVKNTKYYQDEATPEQFGQMAARVEKMKQQQGNSTQMKDFVKKFGGDDKPIIKKNIAAPVKIDFKNIVIPSSPPVRDLEMDRIENNFNKMVKDNEAEKRKNNNSGLAGLLGENK